MDQMLGYANKNGSEGIKSSFYSSDDESIKLDWIFNVVLNFDK